MANRTLVIAEKPAAGKEIAEAIGATKRFLLIRLRYNDQKCIVRFNQ